MKWPTAADPVSATRLFRPAATPPCPAGLGTRYRAPGGGLSGCLDVRTGQFHSQQRTHWTVAALAHFFQQVDAAYPAAERLYLALDNWPVHFLPSLRAPLTATTKIRLVRLPTYAPWTNPVERVWRQLAQEVLHLHRHTDDWPGLCARVQAWLDAAQRPSEALLRYTGLLCPS